MSVLGWCSRRIGGLSMIALIVFSYWVISQESTLQRHGYKFEHPETMTASYSSTSTSGAGIWTYIFVYYCIIVHLAIAIFPIRASWAVWDLMQSLSHTTRNSLKNISSQALHRRGSYASVSSSETLICDQNGFSTSGSSEAGEIEIEMYTDAEEHPRAEPVIHAIVIPNYKEEMDTLRETLEVLASHPQAYNSYDVRTFPFTRMRDSWSSVQCHVSPFSAIAWPLPSLHQPSTRFLEFEGGPGPLRLLASQVHIKLTLALGLPWNGTARAKWRIKSSEPHPGIRQKVPLHRLHRPSFGYSW